MNKKSPDGSKFFPKSELYLPQGKKKTTIIKKIKKRNEEV